MGEKLSFSITGKFITDRARKMYYEEKCGYQATVQYLMLALEGLTVNENQKLEYAQDVILGRAEFVGDVAKGDFGLQVNDKISEDLFKYIEQMHEEIRRLRISLTQYEDLQSTLKTWRDYGKESAEETLFELCDDDAELVDSLLNPKPDFYESEIVGEDEPQFWRRWIQTELEKIVIEDVSDEVSNLLTQNAIAWEFGEGYGWLEPNGDFHKVEFGNHEKFAEEYVLKARWTIMNFKSFGDILLNRGWVLLHNPMQGIAKVTRNERLSLSSNQREFLFKYYIDRERFEEAKEYSVD